MWTREEELELEGRTLPWVPLALIICLALALIQVQTHVSSGDLEGSQLDPKHRNVG